jgi:hypothetical protein
MRPSRKAFAILLAAVIGLVAGIGRAAAQPQPSAEVLLPYFEVESKADGTTTMFAVANALDQPVDIRIDVYSNWGIALSKVPLTLAAHEVRTFNLRTWIAGQMPGRSLPSAELAHLKAALSGQKSPKDNLYYSTPVAGRFTGFVRIATQSPSRPAALWGDYFFLDQARHVTYANDLVNLDTLVGCPGVCKRHALRFLTGAPFDGGTRVMVWTGKLGQPAKSPSPSVLSQAATKIFDESGAQRDSSQTTLLSTQSLTLADLGVRQPFGWLDVQTDKEVFIAVQYGASSGLSLGLQAYCLTTVYDPPPAPGLHLRKLTNGADANDAPGPSIHVGAPVLWEYVVENTGSVKLTDVKVTDDQGEQVTCPGTTLDAGGSMTCTAHGIAVACQYVNIGRATAKDPDGTELEAEDPSHYFGDQNPAIAIEKRTNGQRATAAPGPALAVGSAVTWTYLVTNTGDVNLADVKVVDDKGVAVTCPKTSLRPGEAMTCTGSGTAVAGQYENTGTVTASSACGAKVSAHDVSHYFGEGPPPPPPTACIKIKKYTNGEDADAAPGPQINVGAPVLWDYAVTNTGQVALSSVHVTDSRGVAVSCPKTTLAAGEVMHCSGNGTATAGQYENIGTVTANPPSGSAVTSSDPSHYFGYAPPPPACIKIKKYTNGEDADTAPGPQINVGAPVLWEYVVTNSGQAALSSVHVTDNRGVAVSCPKTTLAVGESMRCTGNGTATAGQYENIGTVTANPPSGSAVTSSDPSHYYGVTPPPPPSGNQGCTPGYWKNHTDSWTTTGYRTSQSVQSAFSAASGYPNLGNAALLDALAFKGGSDLDGAGGNLLRAATASLLNAAHPNVDFPRTAAAIAHDVNAALASRNRDTIIGLASALDADNNLGCPLN